MKFGGIYHEVKTTGERVELSCEKQWFRPSSGKPLLMPTGFPSQSTASAKAANRLTRSSNGSTRTIGVWMLTPRMAG